MREIEFRGKQLHDNKWIFGGICTRFDRSFIIGISKREIIDGIEVEPKTVGQYTGLTDKNGTKIFEGDIVKHSIGIFIVKWSCGSFLCSGVDINHLTELASLHNNCEVIGNIYDNPELLKGSECND